MLKEFRLPTYLELSKEQDRILRKLQDIDRAIIAGSPGTGKSVIILLLAEKLKKDKKPYLCLLYNNVLKNMSSSLMPDVNINTWHLWFINYFKQLYKTPPSEIKPYQYDWNKIDEIISNHDELPKNSEIALIIDEGQDMPKQFYDFIDEHFEKIFVSADENQQICEENSCLADIKKRLDIQQNHFTLSSNYRNTKQIAQLAESFYCNTRAKPPELPERDGEIPMLIKLSDKNKIIERVAIRHKVNPKKLIGILTPNNTVREYYYNSLKKELETKGIQNSIYTYANGNKNEPINFESGGVVVINAQSSKGLEFDEVFIVELEEFYYNDNDNEAFRKKMYVLTSRAKENLFIIIDTFKNIDGKPDKRRQILAQFPDDETILRHWSKK